jgi:hypothetical protein
MADDERTRSRPGRFIKKAIPWVLLATSAGVTVEQAFNPNQRQAANNQYRLKASDNAPPLTQAVVDAEYEKLYEEISGAKQEAESEKKKLTILLGENHVSPVSYLHKILILDIAAKLGIQDAICEQSIPFLHSDKLTNIGKALDILHLNSLDTEVALSKLDPLPDKEHEVLEYILASAKGREYVAMVNDALNSASICDQESISQRDNPLWQPSCGQSILDIMQYKDHVGDSDRYDEARIGGLLSALENKGINVSKEELLRSGDAATLSTLSKSRFDPDVENSMARAIDDFPDHAVAVYGKGHLPFLVGKLATDRSKKLLVYDVSNSQDQFSEEVELLDRQTEQFDQRMKQIDALVAAGRVHKMNVDCKPPSYADATYMMLSASLKHSVDDDQIDQKTAESFKLFLLRARKEADQLNPVQPAQRGR